MGDRGARLCDVQAEAPIGNGSAPEILAAEELPHLDQWYCEHILDAWYEGFYRYDGGEVRVLYEDALMWTLVDDVLPIRGLSDRPYGFWGEPPGTGDDG